MNKKSMFDRFILEELEAIREMTRQDNDFQRFNVALGYAIDEILMKNDFEDFREKPEYGLHNGVGAS